MAEDRKGGRGGGQRPSSRSAQGGSRSGGAQGGKSGGRSSGAPQRGTGKPGRAGGAGASSRGSGSASGGKPRTGGGYARSTGTGGGKPRTGGEGGYSRGTGTGKPRTGGESGYSRGTGTGKPRTGGAAGSGSRSSGGAGGYSRSTGGAGGYGRSGGEGGKPRTSSSGGYSRGAAGSGSRSTGGAGGYSRSAGAGAGKPRTSGGGTQSRGGATQSRGGATGGSRFGGKSAGKPAGRYGAERPNRRPADREPEPRTAEQAAYDGPDLPEHITGKELDRGVTAQLKGLPEKLAARVARHLAAAGYYIDEDPELAYQHAKAAKARTQRLAVIREALGEAAYAAGHYAEALAELRAAKRMNGATAYLPIMADCHRALGHPDQAIKLAHSPSVANFRPEAKAEMTLVESGARRDMGQLDAALRILELAPLSSKTRASWVVRLRYAYADTLEAAGRLNDALTWFHRTHAVDGEDLTDAAARAADLERRIGD